VIKKIHTKAPGKFFMLGEFSVLKGGSALVCSVDRFSRVSIEELPDGAEGSILLKYKNAIKKIRFSSFISAGKDFPLIRLINENLSTIDSPLSIEIDSQDLYYQESKLGLGSSASSIVALMEAIDRYLDRTSTTREKIRKGIQYHNLFQAANGSGADIATSYLGGWIEYSKKELAKPIDRPNVDKFNFSIISTLEPVSTPSSIHYFNNWLEGDKVRSRMLLQEMQEVSTYGISAAKESNCLLFSESISHYGSLLRELQDQSGIQIYNAKHNKIAEVALSYGLSYKPCGAGGDLGFVFSRNAIQDEFYDEIMPYGKVIELDLMVSGAIDF
jgi:phosphomevalonate kinase